MIAKNEWWLECPFWLKMLQKWLIKTVFSPPPQFFSTDGAMKHLGGGSWNFWVTSCIYTFNFDEDLAFVSSIHTLLLLRWILINFLYCLRLFAIRLEHPPLCLTYFTKSTSNVQSINRNSMNEVIHYLSFLFVHTSNEWTCSIC